MNDLDARARKSAAAVRGAISEADLKLLATGLPQGATARYPALASRVLAFAGAAALVVMAIGLAVVQMSMFAPDTGSEPTAPPVTVEPPTVPTTTPAPPTTMPTTRPTTTTPSTTQPLDTTPPLLEITSPAEGEVVNKAAVTFAGVTEPGATVMRGKFVAEVTADGAWEIVLIVGEGTTHVTFTAVDQAGNESTATVRVVLEAAAEKPPEYPDFEFSAFGTYGECSEAPPYDEYYGTAAPEAKITITSAYGGGSTTADGEGHWFKKVTFPDAPYGEKFTVTIKDDRGNEKLLEFVSYAG